MIAFFRRTIASKVALGILALVMLAFILTGVFTHELPGTSGLTGGDGSGVVTIGSRSVPAAELENRVRNQYSEYAQQQPGLDLKTFVATGGFDAAVDQTIAAFAMEQYGRSIGLAPSRKQVDGEIAGIPAFAGPDGKFNQQVYEAWLQRSRTNDAQFRDYVAGDIIRRMLYLPVSGATKVTDGLLAPYAALMVQLRKATIGIVPVKALAGGPAPSDAELQAFYKAHLPAYTTPERRVLRYAPVGRDQVAAASAPSEADIRKAYDAGAATKYGARETRDLSQVILPTQAAAQAFKAAVAGGKSFADAAKAQGFGASDIAVGKKSQPEFAALSSPTVAKAAFALPQGGVSDPVKSDFGWHIVKADAIEKIAATPFEKARPEIAADLTKQNQDKALADLVGKVQDALDGGKNFNDVVRAYGLAATDTPALTAGGTNPDDPAWKAPADVTPLLKSGFQAQSDDPPTLETVQQGERYALLAVGRIVPATPIPFAQAKPRLLADYQAVKASERAKAIAAAIEAKVKAGTSMADAFKAAPVKLDPPQPASGRIIDLQRFRGNVPPPVAAMFQTAVGKTRLVPVPGGGGWFVVRVDAIESADKGAVAAAIGLQRNSLSQSASPEYLEQMSHAAENQVGVKRDEKELGALRLRLLGGAPAE